MDVLELHWHLRRVHATGDADSSIVKTIVSLASGSPVLVKAMTPVSLWGYAIMPTSNEKISSYNKWT